MGAKKVRVEKEELGAEELLRRVDQMLVAVKEEPETSYTDRIRNKIEDDEEEDSMDEVIRRKILADDTKEAEDEKFNLKELLEMIEKTKSAAKKAMASKSKENDELRGEIVKQKLEKDSYKEKYVKYKNMAQNNKQNSSAARVKELEEANRDIKSKAELRETLLNEEREKGMEKERENREKLEKERENREKLETRVKLLVEKVKTSEKHSDRQGL